MAPTYQTANVFAPAPPQPCPRGFLARVFCGPDVPVYQTTSGYSTSGGAGVPGSSSSTSTSGGPKPPPFIPTAEPVLVVGDDVWQAVWHDLEQMPRITLVRNG